MSLEACQAAPQRSPRGGSLSLRQRAPEKPSSQVPELQWLGREEFPGYLIETTRRVTGKATYPRIQVSAYPDAMMRSAMRARLPSLPFPFPFGPPVSPLSPPLSFPFPARSAPCSLPAPPSRRFPRSPPVPPRCLPVLLLFSPEGSYGSPLTSALPVDSAIHGLTRSLAFLPP